MVHLILKIILSYLIGSFPTAIIAGKILKNVDIREHGSGNAGATNVFRVLGWQAGILVLLVDMFKGFAAVWWLSPRVADPELATLYSILIGIAAILGHIWTIFAGFKGGKGVGTAAGVFLALQPAAVLLSLVTFIIVVVRTRYVSLGSMLAAMMLPIYVVILKYLFLYTISNLVLFVSIVLAILIVYMHRENIKRLRAGSENKISLSKGDKKSEG